VPDPADTFNLSGGSLSISPPFTLTGQINWTNGTLSGALTAGGGATLNWQWVRPFNRRGRLPRCTWPEPTWPAPTG
jgi:hypothetical protein